MALFTIGSLQTGDDLAPLICAEIGAGHDGNLEKALTLMENVAAVGIKAVKFQFYTADELVADRERIVTWGPQEKQTSEPVGQMFDRLSLSKEAFIKIFKRARELKLEPFATPFSKAGVDFLISLNVPCIKIASSDINYHDFLCYIARTGKPVILSLGKCSLAEADNAVRCLSENGCGSLALLHCVSAYPSPMEEMNLRIIKTLKQLYPNYVIGISDHSLGIVAPVAAVALGARIIEKHVTLNKQDSGPDHWFSSDMKELADLKSQVSDTYAALGQSHKRILSCEEGGRVRATRSLVAARDMQAGETVEMSDLKALRPGTGIAPNYSSVVAGMILKKTIRENEVLTWDHFK